MLPVLVRNMALMAACLRVESSSVGTSVTLRISVPSLSNANPQQSLTRDVFTIRWHAPVGTLLGGGTYTVLGDFVSGAVETYIAAYGAPTGGCAGAFEPVGAASGPATTGAGVGGVTGTGAGVVVSTGTHNFGSLLSSSGKPVLNVAIMNEKKFF